MAHGPFAGTYRFVVSKPGYSTFTRDVEPDTQQQIAVVLSPQQGPADFRR
jgi:hypothetical protein